MKKVGKRGGEEENHRKSDGRKKMIEEALMILKWCQRCVPHATTKSLIPATFTP